MYLLVPDSSLPIALTGSELSLQLCWVTTGLLADAVTNSRPDSCSEFADLTSWLLACYVGTFFPCSDPQLLGHLSWPSSLSLTPKLSVEYSRFTLGLPRKILYIKSDLFTNLGRSVFAGTTPVSHQLQTRYFVLGDAELVCPSRYLNDPNYELAFIPLSKLSN